MNERAFDDQSTADDLLILPIEQSGPSAIPKDKGFILNQIGRTVIPIFATSRVMDSPRTECLSRTHCIILALIITVLISKR